MVGAFQGHVSSFLVTGLTICPADPLHNGSVGVKKGNQLPQLKDVTPLATAEAEYPLGKLAEDGVRYRDAYQYV